MPLAFADKRRWKKTAKGRRWASKSAGRWQGRRLRWTRARGLFRASALPIVWQGSGREIQLGVVVALDEDKRRRASGINALSDLVAADLEHVNGLIRAKIGSD